MSGHLLYIPLDMATTPTDGECYANRWWSVHPEKGVAFYASSLRQRIDGEENIPSPQCNHNEATCRMLTKKLYPDHEAMPIPVVFAQHALREMARLRKAQS